MKGAGRSHSPVSLPGRASSRINPPAVSAVIPRAAASGDTRSVMGLGTAQRNISAALVVAGQNFDLDVITYLMVIAVIGLVVLMPAAGELGKRAKAAATEAAA